MITSLFLAQGPSLQPTLMFRSFVLSFFCQRNLPLYNTQYVQHTICITHICSLCHKRCCCSVTKTSMCLNKDIHILSWLKPDFNSDKKNYVFYEHNIAKRFVLIVKISGLQLPTLCYRRQNSPKVGAVLYNSCMNQRYFN